MCQELFFLQCIYSSDSDKPSVQLDETTHFLNFCVIYFKMSYLSLLSFYALVLSHRKIVLIVFHIHHNSFLTQLSYNFGLKTLSWSTVCSLSVSTRSSFSLPKIFSHNLTKRNTNLMWTCILLFLSSFCFHCFSFWLSHQVYLNNSLKRDLLWLSQLFFLLKSEALILKTCLKTWHYLNPVLLLFFVTMCHPLLLIPFLHWLSQQLFTGYLLWALKCWPYRFWRESKFLFSLSFTKTSVLFSERSHPLQMLI